MGDDKEPELFWPGTLRFGFILPTRHSKLTTHPPLKIVLVVMQSLPQTLVFHFMLQPGQKPGFIGLPVVFAVRPEGVHLAFHTGELAP
jgi:hypothetical protein